MSIWDQFNGLPSLIELASMALAAWRVAVFLVRESGPWRIVRRVREWSGIDHDIEGRPLPYLGGMPGSLFSCVWCMSFWTAIIVYVVGIYAEIVIVVLALWGLAALIETAVGYVAFHSYNHEPEPRWPSGGDSNASWGNIKKREETHSSKEALKDGASENPDKAILG